MGRSKTRVGKMGVGKRETTGIIPHPLLPISSICIGIAIESNGRIQLWHLQLRVCALSRVSNFYGQLF